MQAHHNSLKCLGLRYLKESSYVSLLVPREHQELVLLWILPPPFDIWLTAICSGSFFVVASGFWGFCPSNLGLIFLAGVP